MFGNLPLWNIVWITISVLVAIKVLLIPCYSSTDFEVHRNWMAITFQKPLDQWYFEKTSEWTLDYPPFFAYFEWGLAQLASKLKLDSILQISKEAIINKEVLIYQRLTVIFCDFIYMLLCYLFAAKYLEVSDTLPKKIIGSIRVTLFVLLAANSGLVMVDNIHFQYNSLLTALVILSTLLVSNRCFILGALTFCSLLNFKHIYLYYGPAFAVYYLKNYFELKQFSASKTLSTVWKGVVLGITMVLPFLASLGPFFLKGGVEGLMQIISRLFPVSRGLTHAYWAPNFWALYNFVDMVLYRILKVFKVEGLKPSSYSSGLVQEHSHSVLPSITPIISLACIIYSLAPFILLFLQKKKDLFSLYLVISALSFFYFGYHVHEKALLLISIPLIIVSLTKPKFIPVSIMLSTITSFSLFPLLFTTFEIFIKYGLAGAYLSLSLFLYSQSYKLRIHHFLPTWVILYITGLGIVEFYNSFVHKYLFDNGLEFFPLMMISVYNAIGVSICYVWILKLSIEEDSLIFLKKKKCEVREALIRDGAFPVQSVESIEEVQIIGGVDISTSKINPELGIATLSIYSFPDFKLLMTYDESVFITEPYINDYLALREALPVSEMVRSFVSKYPNLRPDIILCDGNGEFHSRGCGVACHIGALSGIPTIGVAKKLNISLLKHLGANDKTIEEAEKFIEKVANEKSSGFVAFDFIRPTVLNIIRSEGSKMPLFVSAGYGIDLDLATEIVIKSAKTKVCEPIRAADLLSRQKIREFYDD